MTRFQEGWVLALHRGTLHKVQKYLTMKCKRGKTKGQRAAQIFQVLEEITFFPLVGSGLSTLLEIKTQNGKKKKMSGKCSGFKENLG